MEFKLITDRARETADNEITEKYSRLMEESILRNPAFWLWTHRRWKHKRNQAEKPAVGQIRESEEPAAGSTGIRYKSNAKWGPEI